MASEDIYLQMKAALAKMLEASRAMVKDPHNREVFEAYRLAAREHARLFDQWTMANTRSVEFWGPYIDRHLSLKQEERAQGDSFPLPFPSRKQ